MAYITLSENILAALIIAARGDLGETLGEAAMHLELWQEANDCHFGTGKEDVASSLQLLWYLDPDINARCRLSAEVLECLTLREAVPILLKYKHWSSNDEGDYWSELSSRLVKGSSEPLCSTSFRNHEMVQFFTQGESPKPGPTLAFLDGLGFSNSYLKKCAEASILLG